MSLTKSDSLRTIACAGFVPIWRWVSLASARGSIWHRPLHSGELLAVNSPETQALGASKKTAIDQVLNGKDCPPLVTAGRGRIGVTIVSLDPVKAARLGMPLKGTSIEKVAPGGNAEKAGLRYADVIVSIDTTSVGDDIDFLVAMGKVSIGSNMLLKVWRKDAFIDIPVLVGPPT